MSPRRWGEASPPPPPRVDRVATSFYKLAAERRTMGFIALVRPLTFEEQCDEQRRIRDVSDEDRDPDSPPAIRFRVGYSLDLLTSLAIAETLKSVQGNLVEAARILNISTRTIYRHLLKLKKALP